MKLKSPLPCSYIEYSFVFQGAFFIWGRSLKNKYGSILFQGLTFQNMSKSQQREGQSETDMESKTEKRNMSLQSLEQNLFFLAIFLN